jgi:hypothetical protein
MSVEGVAVIPEIRPGRTLASYISGNSMYQDGAAACHVWVGCRLAAVTESSSGESRGLR